MVHILQTTFPYAFSLIKPAYTESLKFIPKDLIDNKSE